MTDFFLYFRCLVWIISTKNEESIWSRSTRQNNAGAINLKYKLYKLEKLKSVGNSEESKEITQLLKMLILFLSTDAFWSEYIQLSHWITTLTSV